MNPYIDEATGTPFNKLGIRDRKAFQDLEYAVTDVRVAELIVKPIQGRYDFEHLSKIHEHVFSDLYEWAGKARTVNFSKRDALEPQWTSPFAPANHVRQIVDDASRQLESSNYLKGLGKDEFVNRLSAYYTAVNFAHPFPEGNGRSTQTLISHLAREAGYELNFGAVSRDEWCHAAARSMPQRHVREPGVMRKHDTAPIHAAFSKIVEPLRERERSTGLER